MVSGNPEEAVALFLSFRLRHCFRSYSDVDVAQRVVQRDRSLHVCSRHQWRSWPDTNRVTREIVTNPTRKFWGTLVGITSPDCCGLKLRWKVVPDPLNFDPRTKNSRLRPWSTPRRMRPKWKKKGRKFHEDDPVELVRSGDTNNDIKILK